MPAWFQDLQNHLFDTVENTFAESATWVPSAGGDQVAGLMLFKEPTKPAGYYADADYEIDYVTAEYRLGQFDGLFESVYAGNVETIFINSVEYITRLATKKYDGQTIILRLNPVN